MSLFLIEDLIQDIKDSEHFPLSQTTFTDAKLIRIINKEILSKIVPIVISVREEYYAQSVLLTLTNDKYRYTIPSRATGAAFKNLFWLRDRTKLLERVPLARVNPHNLGNHIRQRGPYCFFLEGDQILLDKIPSSISSTEDLLCAFHRRPNEVVATTSATKITAKSVGASTTTFTVNTDLTGSLSAGSLIDFINGQPPFLLWAEDVAISSITATSIVVSNDDIKNEASEVEIGTNDYICAAGQTNIPMIPAEGFPLLNEFVCYRVMKAQGAHDKLGDIKESIKANLDNFYKLITQRVENEPEITIDRDGFINILGSEF